MKTTQCQKILAYMQKFGSITPMDALREQGYAIASTTKSSKNKFGDLVNFAEYSLKEDVA